VQKLLQTRTGTIAVGMFAAIVAAAVLFVFLSRYQDSIDKSSQPVSVLVAKQLIAQGTPGDQVAARELFQVSEIRRDEVKDGAITDSAALRGRIATVEIFPGQQLTETDFSAKPKDALDYKLTGDQRAVAVPLDPAHGIIGFVTAGDHADVFAGFNVVRVDQSGVPLQQGGQPRPVLKTILQDVLVLDAPAEVATGIGATRQANVVLRLTDRQANDLAFSSDNGKVWIALRPQSGAKQSKPRIVTLETLLLGLKPVTVTRSFGGRP
jgi:Flp pilus assembly protein CpaB